MKRYVQIFSLLFLCGLFSKLLSQNVGDYGSAGTGNWGTTGTNWVVCQTEGTWAGATPAPSAPTTSTNVWIRAGHTVTVEASPKNAKNLYVESGAILTSTASIGSPNYITIAGSTIQVNGKFGTSSNGLGLNLSGAGGPVTIQGNNVDSCVITRLRPSAAGVSVTISRNIFLNYPASSTGSTIYNNGQNNYTVTISSGATVTTTTGGYVSVGTTGTNDPSTGGNLTLNIYGTLTTGDNANLNLRNTSGYTTTLNIYSGGVVNVGGALIAPSATIGNVVINIASGGVLNLIGAYSTDASKASYTLNGTIDVGNATSANLGTVTVSSTGKLRLKTGTFPSGSVTLNPGSTVEYYGSSALTLPTSPSTYQNLQINNTAGVTLASNITVSGTLLLTNGIVTTGSNVLTATSVARDNGYVYGSLKKTVSTATEFEVGTPTGYTPIGIEPYGSGEFTVKTVVGKHPNRIGENVLGMYWTLTAGSGITGANLVFNYLQSDVNGNEAAYALYRWNGSSWISEGGVLDVEANTIAVGGVTEFSDWTLGEGEALPVKLTSFVVTQSGRGALLQWRTATEVNSAYFEVYRRSVGSEQRTLVGKVQAAGTSNSPKEYTYTDHNVGSGRYVYELKQVDIDGTSEMVGSAEVEILAPKELTLGNYPNSFNPQTVIEFTVPEDGYAVVKVYNVVGQEVATLYSGMAKAGEYYRMTFGGNQLSSGLYYTVLETNGQRMVKKMVLMK